MAWDSGHLLAQGAVVVEAQVGWGWQRVCLERRRLRRAGGSGGEIASVAAVGLKLSWCAVKKGVLAMVVNVHIEIRVRK